MSPPLTLSQLLESLHPPSDFARYEEVTQEQRSALDEWAAKATHLLADVKALVTKSAVIARERPTSSESSTSHDPDQDREASVDNGDGLSVDERAAVVARVSPFSFDLASLNEEASKSIYEEEQKVLQEESPWIRPESKVIARDILATINGGQPDPALAKHLLSHTIKPIFLASNPHPHINPLTGKGLPPSQVGRTPQQGGVSSITQDFYENEGQQWKSWVGVGAVLYYCVENIPEDAYEDVWHLVVPPLMTLLDDYQARYKLWGLFIARSMLRRVPPSILRKTGMDGLLRSSFTKALAHQQPPLGPSILRLAITQSLELTLLTTSNGTKQRFDSLCTLLGEGVITDIWTYAFDKPDVVRATLDALPAVIKALDVGCARFLQSLIPQLVHPLVLPSKQTPIPGLPPIDLLQLQLQLSSLRTLIPLMEVCAPRMESWRFTILDALARCWVSMVVDRSGDMLKYVPSAFPSLQKREGLPSQRGSTDEDGQLSEEILIDPEVVIPANSHDIKDNMICLRTLLQMSCMQLARGSPSVREDYERLVGSGPQVFGGLFEYVL